MHSMLVKLSDGIYFNTYTIQLLHKIVLTYVLFVRGEGRGGMCYSSIHLVTPAPKFLISHRNCLQDGCPTDRTLLEEKQQREAELTEQWKQREEEHRIREAELKEEHRLCEEEATRRQREAKDQLKLFQTPY